MPMLGGPATCQCASSLARSRCLIANETPYFLSCLSTYKTGHRVALIVGIHRWDSANVELLRNSWVLINIK